MKDIIEGEMGIGRFEKFNLQATDTNHLTKEFKEALIEWIKLELRLLKRFIKFHLFQ